MAKGKLFEYAILFHPKPRKVGDETVTDQSTMLNGGVKQVVAGAEQEVAIIAAREIPAEYLDKLDQVDIAIRPF